MPAVIKHEICINLQGLIQAETFHPRYWDTDASEHVDTVRQLGKSAKDYYYSIRETELEYYDIVCSAEYGEL